MKSLRALIVAAVLMVPPFTFASVKAEACHAPNHISLGDPVCCCRTSTYAGQSVTICPCD